MILMCHSFSQLWSSQWERTKGFSYKEKRLGLKVPLNWEAFYKLVNSRILRTQNQTSSNQVAWVALVAKYLKFQTCLTSLISKGLQELKRNMPLGHLKIMILIVHIKLISIEHKTWTSLIHQEQVGKRPRFHLNLFQLDRVGYLNQEELRKEVERRLGVIWLLISTFRITLRSTETP